MLFLFSPLPLLIYLNSQKQYKHFPHNVSFVILQALYPITLQFHLVIFAAQTISSSYKDVGHSCQLHHCSSGMLLVVEPFIYPQITWLLIVYFQIFQQFTQFSLICYQIRRQIYHIYILNRQLLFQFIANLAFLAFARNLGNSFLTFISSISFKISG